MATVCAGWAFSGGHSVSGVCGLLLLGSQVVRSYGSRTRSPANKADVEDEKRTKYALVAGDSPTSGEK